MQVDAAHNFLFAPEALEAAITEKTKAVVINSPANPTGGIAGREALERLAGIIMRHDLWVISDEVYRELVYDGNEAFSMAMLPGMRERTVVVNSFSKTYAMTGWRVGYALGPACIIGNMVKLQENVAACVNSAAQYGALAALEGPREPVDRMVRAYGRRRQMILDGFASIPGLACYTPQGAFYAFVDISATGMKAGVWISPRGVSIRPRRAMPSVAERVKVTCLAWAFIGQRHSRSRPRCHPSDRLSGQTAERKGAEMENAHDERNGDRQADQTRQHADDHAHAVAVEHGKGDDAEADIGYGIDEGDRNDHYQPHRDDE